MGVPDTESSLQYPPSLQLKLYQAFIFSVPILFTIILFLLFYLFYLKRRRSANPPSSSSYLPQRISTINQPATVLSLSLEVGLKQQFREKLPIIIFGDEESRARDTQCCVCLGDFEMKEELHQIPSCKHLFHVDCIHHWLLTNASCPLCRSSVLPTKKGSNVEFDTHGTTVANVGEDGLQQVLRVRELVGTVD